MQGKPSPDVVSGHLTSRVTPLLGLCDTEMAAWEKLSDAQRHRNTPFLSLRFARAVALAQGRVHVCVIRSGERIIGFFPFQFASALHQALRVAEPIGADLNGYFGLIAEDSFRISTARLLRLASLTYVGFTDLDETQLVYGLEGENPGPAFVMRLEGKNSSYWQELKAAEKKFVSDSDRSERQLAAACGPLRFCFTHSDVELHLRQVIDVKRKQYTRTGREDALGPAWKRQVLSWLAANPGPDCEGVLSTLYAGETWVASHFGLQKNGTLYYWFPVYDPEFSRYSPGRLLLKKMIEHSGAVGLRAVDFCSGDNPYKQKFANEKRVVLRGAWHRPGARSLAYRLACSIVWRWAAASEKWPVLGSSASINKGGRS